MPEVDRIFSALGDARRRDILRILAGGPRSVGDIARRLPVSRPAVSQHLKVLEASGLVRHRAQGTRRLYQVDGAGVLALREYLDSLWDTALGRFKVAAERPQQPEQE